MVQELQNRRILICLPFFSLGGAETQAFLLARFLKQNAGANVEVCAFEEKGGKLKDLLEQHDIPAFLHPANLSLFHRGGMGKFKLLFGFLRMLRQKKYDFIIPFTYYPNLICNAVWPWSGSRKCFWNQRGMENLGVSRIERMVAKRKNHYIGNSQACLDFIRTRHQSQGSSFTLIRNAVNMRTPTAGSAAVRKNLGIPEQAVILCCVANFYPEKDHPTLLKAFSILKHELKPSSDVFLVMTGYSIRDEFVNRAKAVAYDEKLSGSAIFMGSNNQVPDLLEASDIGVLTSVSEGSPNAVLEYMAQQLPIVATAIPAVREMLGDDYPYLFEPGNARALAEKLLLLVNSTELRLKNGKGNQELVLREYDPQRMYNGYCDLLKSYL